MGQAIKSLRHPQNRGRAILVVIAVILLLLLCVALICRWWPSPCPPPVANPNGPYSVGEGQPLTFNGSGSTGCNLSYQWDFGDGKGKDSGASPSYTYPDGSAQYTVTLTVTDDKGRTASATTQVTVNNLPPTAEAGGPYTCQVNQVIPLSGKCDDPGDIDKQSLSCTWADFSGAAVTQPNYTCPPNPGDITVTLTATDKDGASAQDSAIITVKSPPTPTMIMADADGPYTSTVGTPVTFDGSGSKPKELIKDYTWDFGDGSVQTSQEAIISHTYTTTNTYTVILTVTGTATATGQIATATTVATINSPLPSNILPVAVVHCPPGLRSKDGLCLHFDGSRSFDADGSIATYSWDFGDGGTDTGPMVEHCFSARNSYTVTLTVTDDKGVQDSSSIAIDIR